jgi:hypothetical protein
VSCGTPLRAARGRVGSACVSTAHPVDCRPAQNHTVVRWASPNQQAAAEWRSGTASSARAYAAVLSELVSIVAAAEWYYLDEAQAHQGPYTLEVMRPLLSSMHLFRAMPSPWRDVICRLGVMSCAASPSMKVSA